MDVSFSEHVDKLIAQLKAELVKHYEKDVAAPRAASKAEDSDDSEASRPAPLHLLSAQRHMKRLPSAKAPPMLPRRIFRSTSSTDSDEEAMWSPGKGELLTPKNCEEKPKLPDVPKDRFASAPDATPKILMVSQVPTTPQTLPLPNTIEQADSRSEAEPEEAKEIEKKSSGSSSSSSSSGSSASFASTSDGEGNGKAKDGFRKRRSDSSIPSFFKNEDRHSRIWQFMEDPDSSRAAFYFASVQNYFLTLTSLATISQASQDPLVPNILVVNLLQCVTEALLIVDCIAHWYVSQSFKAFMKSPYNIIDILAFLPLPLRIAVGVPTMPTMEQSPVAHFILVCFVPLIRMLKLVRRFQKLQLLLHVLSTVSDALKLLLYMVSIIVLLFSTVLYVDDPDNVDSLSTAIYMSTVTVTTVGYGDVTPKTWPARIVSGCLCFISVLFMAMPLSVVGNAMSQTWSDRHRILLVTRARQRLKNWGVSAGDMPRLFKKFDADGNGELGMDEFVDLISRMKIGMKPSEASDLFLAFDTDGSGGIDEEEFMKALFPLDYRRMYRRASGVTFGA